MEAVADHRGVLNAYGTMVVALLLVACCEGAEPIGRLTLSLEASEGAKSVEE